MCMHTYDSEYLQFENMNFVITKFWDSGFDVEVLFTASQRATQWIHPGCICVFTQMDAGNWAFAPDVFATTGLC